MSEEFSSVVRVRYSDTDQMGVVYYANYFKWLEIARTELLRVQGMTYDSIEKEQGLALPAIEAYCKYLFPARYDDEVLIKTQISEIKSAKIRFDYVVTNKASGVKLVIAYTTHVFIDRQRKPVKIPDAIREIFERYKK